MEQSRQTAQVLGRGTFRLVVAVGGAAIAGATAAGFVLAAHLVTSSHSHPAASSAAPQSIHRTVEGSPPGARQVEAEFVGVINASSAEIGSRAKISRASCVQGDPGSYLCSFVRAVPPNAGVCALAMLEWTPDGDSTYSVQTAGRVPLAPGQCGPVTKILHLFANS